MRRHLVVITTAVLVLAGAAVAAFALLSDKVSSNLANEERECCWEDGATPAWMSGQMGLGVPGAASDRRAGYKTGSRYDVGILAFTLPSRDADRYLAPLNPEGAGMIPNLHPEPENYRPAAPFGHLRLPEPEALVEGLRKGGLCPGDVEAPDGKHIRYCVDLFAHEFKPGATRIYARATVEPGLTPPPAASGE
ncbi:MAG TPA: hypothetical protein VFH94_01645 [Streptomyces sp.]|nr:hypothetical protein [Streptomyces sp.]